MVCSTTLMWRTLLIGCAFGGLVQPAFAQETAPADDLGATDEIVVTGTRIVRDGFDAPTPTTVISDEEIRQSAQTNLADYLNQLPELAGSLSPATNRNGATSGGNFINLRGLGTNRTLVLLDGRRVAPSSPNGNVDFALLPQSLVKRVDLVTGGASASWGSDAVAGVVNLVLDKSFTGLKGEVVKGVTDEGDGQTFKVNLSFGTSFAGGKGHFLLSGEHNEIHGIKAHERDWFRGWNLVNNPAFVPGNGEPQSIIVSGVGLASATPGGLITGGPLRGTQFLADGTPAPFDFGTTSGILSYGGDAYIAGRDADIITPVEWDTIFARGQYEFSPAITMFIEGSYAAADSRYNVRYPQYDNARALQIRADNAFLDPAIAAQMAPGSTFPLGKLLTNAGIVAVDSKRELYRGVAGLEGNLGAGWKWDAYYQYGRTIFDTAVVNNTINARYALAADAVFDGGGNIVCRSTLTNPTNGCVPFNVFGTGPIPQASRDYFIGAATQKTVIEQHVAALNLNGSPFDLWAGSVSVAIGVEYREDKYNAKNPDPLSLTNAWFAGNYKPSKGNYNVKEAYFETVVPLLKDAPMAKSLDLQGALRFTDYSTSGSVETWKLGLSWEIFSDLRVRGTRSRDIRAPNLQELFLSASTTNASIVDPTPPPGAPNPYSILRVISGNTDLAPEKADTKALGFVYSPSWLSGFAGSFDYYHIGIKDAIFTTTDAQTILNQCAAGISTFCSAITRGGDGLISQVMAVPQNVQTEKLEGFDVEVSWRGELGDAQLSARLLASHVIARTVAAIGGSQDFVGLTTDASGVPAWRGLASLTYERGGFSTTLTGRYVDGGVLNKNWGAADVSDNTIPSRTYFDLAVSKRIETNMGTFQMFGIVQNLLDKDPPVVVPTGQNAFFTTATAPYFFDNVGRQFRVGIRFEI